MSSTGKKYHDAHCIEEKRGIKYRLAFVILLLLVRTPRVPNGGATAGSMRASVVVDVCWHLYSQSFLFFPVIFHNLPKFLSHYDSKLLSPLLGVIHAMRIRASKLLCPTYKPLCMYPQLPAGPDQETCFGQNIGYRWMSTAGSCVRQIPIEIQSCPACQTKKREKSRLTSWLIHAGHR